MKHLKLGTKTLHFIKTDNGDIKLKDGMLFKYSYTLRSKWNEVTYKVSDGVAVFIESTEYWNSVKGETTTKGKDVPLTLFNSGFYNNYEIVRN